MCSSCATRLFLVWVESCNMYCWIMWIKFWPNEKVSGHFSFSFSYTLPVNSMFWFIKF